MSREIKSKENTEENSKPSYLRFGESYTSLVLGIIVVIIGTILLLSFARNRNANRVDDTTSSVPEGITEITQTNMETVIRSVRLTPTLTPQPTATSTPKVPVTKKLENFTGKKNKITEKPTLAPTKMPVKPTVALSEPDNNVQKVEKIYITKSGDNLWSIAERNYKSGYNWVDIQRANNISNPDSINIGTKLVLPNVDQKNATSVPELKIFVTDKGLGSSSVQKISGVDYIIEEGDNLWDIALRAYGDGYKWTELQRINKVNNPNLIYPGNKLIIPRS